jgi:hypothetical protein
MRSLLFSVSLILIGTQAFANETMSIALSTFVHGKAYQSKRPLERFSFLGADLDGIHEKSACQTITLTTNPKTGYLEWEKTVSDYGPETWYKPSRVDYTIQIVKDQAMSFPYNIRTTINAGGVVTKSSTWKESQFFATTSGSSFTAELFGERNYDKLEVTPIIIVKSCN